MRRTSGCRSSRPLGVLLGISALAQHRAGMLLLSLLLIIFFMIEGMSKVVFALTIRLPNWLWVCQRGALGRAVALCFCRDAGHCAVADRADAGARPHRHWRGPWCDGVEASRASGARRLIPKAPGSGAIFFNELTEGAEMAQQPEIADAKTPSHRPRLAGAVPHGAFTWGRSGPHPREDWFEIDGISGTSAGAMNAAILAAGACRRAADRA